MDNQTPPVTNQQTETSSVQSTPPAKAFLSAKIILLIITSLILIAGGGTYFVLNSKSKPKPAPIVFQAAPTSTPTPTVDPTASWKTYTDTIISFKYPNSWVFKSPPVLNASSYNISSPDQKYGGEGGALISGAILYDPVASKMILPNVTPDHAFDSRKADILESRTVNVGTSTGIVYKLQNTRTISFVFLIQNGGKSTGVGLETLSQNITTYQSIFDQIFSTFKFTDVSQVTDTSNWKRYTNAKGKYLLQYSPIFTFTEDASGNIAGNLLNNKVVIVTEPTVLSLSNYIDQKTWCISISSTTGKSFNLDSENSRRYDKTPCGITGSTDIYSVHKGIAYHINIETQQNFDVVQPIFDQILSTFKFTQ